MILRRYPRDRFSLRCHEGQIHVLRGVIINNGEGDAPAKADLCVDWPAQTQREGTFAVFDRVVEQIDRHLTSGAFCGSRKCKTETRSPARFAANFDGAAVSFHQPAHDRQAEAGGAGA